MKSPTYDIFISYRRESGAATAKHLRDVLTARGYSVFFDTDSLRSGSFNQELFQVIRNCKDFILILSPGALDRCSNENDWVRLELACALQNGKNVIPIMSNDFSFPEELPEDISEIRWQNGIIVHIDYFDAMVEKLVTFLRSRPRQRKLARRLLAAAVLCAVAALVIFLALRPAGTKEKDVLPEKEILSMVQEGDAAYDAGDYAAAFGHYLQAAQQGNAAAQYSLGSMYLNGLGVKQSAEKGFEYTKLASDQGYAPAQANLGYCYQYGIGVEQSHENALELYMLAAAQGDAAGESNLGFMYSQGLGVKQSYEKAAEYFLLAADQEYPAALYYLGSMYQYGLGVEQSYDKAEACYRSAAEKGHRDARAILEEWASDGAPVPAE